ncbi:hypothetical protein GOODEAATRI_021756, partial [Goodea atripinnis]
MQTLHTEQLWLHCSATCNPVFSWRHIESKELLRATNQALLKKFETLGLTSLK